jgi:hypothetical protein
MTAAPSTFYVMVVRSITTATTATESAAATAAATESAAATAAATATAAAAAAAAESATAAAATTARTLLRFVHFERATVELGAIELLDGRSSLRRITHRHEGKSTRLPGFAIGRHGNLADFAG